MKERLIQLMQLLGVSPTQFANQIGVQRATLQHILSGRNEASLKIVTGINQAYPSVNLPWLLYGQGPAINQSSSLDFKGSEITEDKRQPADNLIFPYEDMISPEFKNLSTDNDTSYNSPLQQTDGQKDLNASGVQHHQEAQNDSPSTSCRKIKEIVIFFDDGTFKKFIPDAAF